MLTVKVFATMLLFVFTITGLRFLVRLYRIRLDFFLYQVFISVFSHSGFCANLYLFMYYLHFCIMCLYSCVFVYVCYSSDYFFGVVYPNFSLYPAGARTPYSTPCSTATAVL